MKAEAIESMRTNKRPYKELNEDEKEVCQEALIAGKIFWLNAGDEGIDRAFAIDEDWHFKDTDVVHIVDDWPNPTVVECKVELTDGVYDFLLPEKMSPCYIDVAPRHPNFIGYRYRGGQISELPRMQAGEDEPALIPTHVLFKKGKGQ